MKRTALVLLLACALNASAIELPIEGRQRLTDGWLFVRGDIGGAWEAVRPKQKEDVPIWDTVALPHCFNAVDAVNPYINYYQGPGWYKRLLDVRNPHPGGRTILFFEGAGQTTDVYIHTTLVAHHTGGYDRWWVDITDAVEAFRRLPAEERFGGKVPLSIRCDNSRRSEVIPSDLSDFNLYGGIYRPLELAYLTEAVLDGIAVTATLNERMDQGEVEVSLTCKSGKKYPVKVTFAGPGGEKTYSVEVGGSATVKHSVRKPALWSPDSPALYTCRVEFAGQTYEKRFGFRKYEFVEHGGFILNGKPLLIRGTHRHEDHAGVGAAVPDSVTRRELAMIRAMGANFIRLGHYQQSELALELCDSLGMMVWEEIPWCRGGLGGESYREQARQMLRNMVAQHRHHPSVILWGLGNENDWPGDFPEFESDSIRAFMAELNALSHRLDPTRLTSIRRCDFCADVVDVYSPSIWPGWYTGRYTDYRAVMRYYSQRTPRMMHVEWGGDSHAGRFAENPYATIDSVDIHVEYTPEYETRPFTGKIKVPERSDWSESYICDLFDWTLTQQKTMPWIAGGANWTFKDFSTPLRPENPVPYVNQKGLVARDLTPKESYYVFQAHWATKPMLRIFGHGWKVRWGAEGERKQVRVYSNCPEVELFVDGRSAGVRRRDPLAVPAMGLVWEVPMHGGAHKLEARAGGLSDVVAFEYHTEPWGAEAALAARIAQRTAGEVWVEVEVVDARGVRCLDSRRFVEFEYAGDGEMVCDRGTPWASRRVGACNGVARICVALPEGGRGTLAVKSQGLGTVTVGL